MGPKHNEADLYLRIAKKLAVDLPDEKDRVLSLKWLKLLQKSEELTEKKTKLHVIKLLLICLQRKRLVGPFVDAPDPTKKLRQYGWAFQPADIARLILKSEFEKIGKTQFSVDISGDLCEYVATQEIPQFGAHFFYAFSPEQMRIWDGLNTAYIPKGFLSVSTTESPEASILASTIGKDVQEKRARIVVPDGWKKRSDFTEASMIDPATGELHENFVIEVPSAKALDTNLLQSAIEKGVVGDAELSLPTEIERQVGPPSTSSCTKKGRGTPASEKRIAAPHVETVEVKEDDTLTSKTRKMKNASSKSQKKKTKKAFDTIKEEEEVDKTEVFEKKLAEQEARRQELLAMMPERLRNRMIEQQKKKEKKVQEQKVKTPEAFRKGTKSVKYKKMHKPEEFLLDENTQFAPAIDVFADLEYKSPELSTRKTVWIGREIPSAERERQRQLMGIRSPSATGGKDINAPVQSKTPKEITFLQKDIEASWDRSYKKMMERRIALGGRVDSQSPIRKSALEKLNRLKAVQPRRIVFDEMDVAIEPEEVQFEKFVFSEYPDEDQTPSILADEQMSTEDMFGEGQVAPVSVLAAPAPIEQLEKTEILLNTEMETEDIFGEDGILEPSVFFKEVAVEGERQVSPVGPAGASLEGGMRIGKRVVQLPGQAPMEQHFIEQYGDVVFNKSLKAIDPVPDPLSYTPPMNEEVLNRYLDQKLKQLKPGESPRVYGEWAETFRRQIERIEDGEEPDSFPEEDAAEYVYPHDTDKSILSGSEMETNDQFAPDRTALPSPVLLEQSKRQSQVYAKLKDTFEVRKARRIYKAVQETDAEEQDLLEPYIYDFFPVDRPTLLDASITDAGLGHALVEAPEAPVKKGLFDSFESKLDESLKFFVNVENINDKSPRLRLLYDDEFLNRRIQEDELPAEDSLIGDDDLGVEDVFGDGAIAEPRPIRDIEEPRRKTPQKRQKHQSPLKHSHLYLPGGRYKSKLEEILPHGYLSEESFPTDKFLKEDFELSGVESLVSEITAPSFASGVGEASEEVIGVSEIEAEEGGDHIPPEEEILAEVDMQIDDMFGEGRLKTPSPVRRLSPTTLALAKSIKQSVKSQGLINRYRKRRGLPPVEQLKTPFEAVGQYVDARENLLDPLVQEKIKEQFPGLLDEPILEETLDKPLVEKPKKKGPLDEYEETILEEILAERAAALQVDILQDEDMTDDIFTQDQIAEPISIRKISMPRRPPPKATSTPITHSHLYLLRPPLEPIVPREPPPVIPEEQLEDEPEPEFQTALDNTEGLAGHHHLSHDDVELLKTLFDGEMPSSIQVSSLNFHTAQASVEVGDDSGYSPIIKRFHQLSRRTKSKPTSQTTPKLPDAADMSGDDFIPEHELETDDIFGQDQILSPHHVQKSPTILILDRSVKASKDLMVLKNKYRAMQNLPPLEEPPNSVLVEQLKEADIALKNILAEPTVEQAEKSPLGDSNISKDMFASIERDWEESQRRKEEAAAAKEPSLVDERDLDADLFASEEVASPPALHKIPMPPPKSPKRKSPTLQHRTQNFSHLQMPKKYRPPLPYDVPQDDLTKEVFPGDMSEPALELIPSGFEEQLEAQDEPSFYEPPVIERVPKPPPHQSSFFDQTPQEGDLYYNLLTSPAGWRKPALLQAMDQAHRQSQAVQNLKNKFLSMKGLKPVEEQLSQQHLLDLVEAIKEQERIVKQPLISSPHQPQPFKDPFASFEKEVEKELYHSSPPPAERSLIDDKDMEDMFEDEMVATPVHIKTIPMPLPKPSPVLTPKSPKTPPPRRRSPFVGLPTSVKRIKPDMQCIIPHEQIFEQSFPTADESLLEFQPSPKVDDMSSPEMISDADLPPHEELPEGEEEGDGVLTAEDMPIDDMFGDDRVTSPHKVGFSPTEFILARSIQASRDYHNLKNRFRRIKNLPPIDERLPTEYLRRFLNEAANLLEPITNRSLPPEPFGLMDEPVIEKQTVPPLVSPPRKKDLFAEYEQQLIKELYPSPPPPENSLLGAEYFDDALFGEDMIAEPAPIKTIRMPSPKPSPVLTPRSPQTPAHRAVRSHLYLTSPLLKIKSPPPSIPEGPLLFEDPQLLKESPPAFYDNTNDQSPVSPVFDVTGKPIEGSQHRRPLFNIPDISVIPPTPATPIRIPKSAHSVPRPPLPTPSKSLLRSPPRPPEKSLAPKKATYSPVELRLVDDIGPIEVEDSPGIIQFRETAPGIFVPLRDVDEDRFKQRQRLLLANKFGLSPDAIPDETIQKVSPPHLDSPTGSPKQPKSREAVVASVERRKSRTPQRPTPPMARIPPPPFAAPLTATPARKARKISPRILFPAERLSTRMSPHERVKRFLAQQPRIKVQVMPSKTGFSPTDFITKVLPPREELLEMEEPPEEQPQFQISDMNLGDYAYALYIPTEQDLRDAEDIERKRAEEFKTPPGFHVHLPTSQKRNGVSPIKIRELLPHEEGFKWLANYVPFQQQVRGQKPSGYVPFQESAQPQGKNMKGKKKKPHWRVAAMRQETKKLALQPGATPVPPTKARKHGRKPPPPPLRKKSLSPPPGTAILRPGIQAIRQDTSARPPPIPPKTSARKRSARLVPSRLSAATKPSLQAQTVNASYMPSRRPKSPTPSLGMAMKRTGRQVAFTGLPPNKDSQAVSTILTSAITAPLKTPSRRASVGSQLSRTAVATKRMSQPSIHTAKQLLVQPVSARASQPLLRRPPTPSVSAATPAPRPPSRGAASTRKATPSSITWTTVPPRVGRTTSGITTRPMHRPTPGPPPQIATSAMVSQPSIQRPKSPSRLPASARASQRSIQPPRAVPRPREHGARKSQSSIQMSRSAAPPAPPKRQVRASVTRPLSRVESIKNVPAKVGVKSSAQMSKKVSSLPKVPPAPHKEAPIPPSPRHISPTANVSFLSPPLGPPARPAGSPAPEASNWIWQPMRSPIQATSSVYRAPSQSPMSPDEGVPSVRRSPVVAQPVADPHQVESTKPIVGTSGQSMLPSRRNIYRRPLVIPRIRPLKFQNAQAPLLDGAVIRETAPSTSRLKVPSVSPASRRQFAVSSATKGLPGAIGIDSTSDLPAYKGLTSSRTSRLAAPREAIAKTSEPAIPPRPLKLGGTTSEVQITKITSPSGQALLKKSTLVRTTRAPRARFTGPTGLAGIAGPSVAGQSRQEVENKPERDRRTIRQSMVVGKVGRFGAVKKQSSIQMQRDEGQAGAKMMKTNIMQTVKPGEIRKTESKFAMSTKQQKSGAPKPPPRNKKY